MYSLGIGGGGSTGGGESVTTSKAYLRLPDRERVIRQARWGEVTYALSAKDFAALKLEEEKQVKEAAIQAAKYKQKRRKHRKGGGGGGGGGRGKKSTHGAKKSADEQEFMEEIQRYIREREARLMSTAKGSGPGAGPAVPKTR